MKTASFLALALLSTASFAADRGFTCIEDKNWLGHLESGSKSGAILVATPEAADGQYTVTVSADGQTLATITGGAFTEVGGSTFFSAEANESGSEVGVALASVDAFAGEAELKSGRVDKQFKFDIIKPYGSTPLFANEKFKMSCSLN